MESLTSTSATELSFHTWFPILFDSCAHTGGCTSIICTHVMQYTVLPMVSLYPSDLQVAVMGQEMKQSVSKSREEEDNKLVNTNVKMQDLKYLKKAQTSRKH